MLFLLILLGISFNVEANQLESQIISYEHSLNTAEDFNESFQRLNEEWRILADKTPTIIVEQSQLYNQKIQKHFDQLVIVGNLRGRFLTHPSFSMRRFFLEDMSKEKLWDLQRELILTPMKFIAFVLVKVKYVKTQLGMGYDGIKQLIIDAFKIILSFLLPIIIFILLRKIKRYLGEKLTELRRYRFRSQLNYKKFQLISILESYCMNIGLYLTFRTLRTGNSELAFFFAVAEIYFLYRIIITLCYFFLGFLFDRFVKTNEKLAFEEKKKTSAKKIGILFLIYSLLIHSVQYIGGVGLTFFIFNFLIKANLIILVFWLASSWSEEIARFLLSRTGDPVALALGRGMKGVQKVIFSLPGLVYVILVKHLGVIVKLLEQFDFVKQISAKLFKRKLISTESFQEAETIKVPIEYEKLFSNDFEDCPYIHQKDSQLEKIKEVVSSWIENPMEENSVALHGQNGAGKSSVISKLEGHFSEKIRVKRFAPKKRILSEQEIMQELCSLLDIEAPEDASSFIAKDKDISRTLVIIEQSHFLFLSKIDGFKAYKKLLEIINIRLSNVFWLGVFNQNTWRFLNAIYGKDESFRFNFAIQPWTETDIQKMIMSRHEKSEYKLSFHKILNAIGNSFDSESIGEAKEQFFRLLWEQSQGNPRIAMYLWLSSLTFRSGKRIEVGLPQNDEIESLSTFSDSAMFVYAAIIRHETLSVMEALSVTSLSEGAVRFAMKLGLENEFLERHEDGQYEFVTRYQFRILNYLRKKNFIIGN